MSFLTTTETKATGGKVTITAAGNTGETVKILMKDNLLGVYELQDGDTVTEIGAGLRAAIESDVSRHNYNVSGAGADIELIAPNGLGSTINDAGISFYSSDASTADIIQFSGGVSSDYDLAMYSEILNAITRNNAEIKDKAERSAIALVESYLSARYDTASIFSQTGINRHPLVVQIVIDIALYTMHSVSNPDNIPDLRVKLYDDALKILRNIQGLKANPVGLPFTSDDSDNYIKYGGNTKRSNHY